MPRKKSDTFSVFPEIFVVTSNLSDAQFGCLMRSGFEYKQSGTRYTGDDPAIDMAFRFFANQIDRMAEVSEINANNARNKDGERNTAESSEIKPSKKKRTKKSENKENADSVKEEEEKQENAPPIQSFPVHSDPNPLHSFPIHSNPNPDSNNVVADVIGTAAARTLRIMGGQLGKGKVMLSEAQIEDLLEKMGDVEVFDHYVEKLADFIIKRDAHIKDHYRMILKWWREDSRLEEDTN